MSAIFISYRRDGALIHARALFERLSREFGPDEVFIDLEGIEYGVDFVDVLDRQLKGCQVMLALIDPEWATATDKHGHRRIDREYDYVRTEIVSALARGVRTVPVLIEGAEMPDPETLPELMRPLARRNALNLDFNQFDAEIDRLVAAIRKILADQVPPHTTSGSDQQAHEAASNIDPAIPTAQGGGAVARQTAGGAGGIFISYSHRDLPAAKLLCSELEPLGAGVFWLDKSRPRTRDEWERHLTRGLKCCDLFLALISANTEALARGYFRTEWNEVVERDSEFILGHRIVVPVVVDSEFDGDAGRFKAIPERFRGLQFSHAPGGHVSKELRETILDALRELGRRRPA
jgi:TIR domain